MVKASTVNSTEVFEVVVKCTDYKHAAIIANAIADVLPDDGAGSIKGDSRLLPQVNGVGQLGKAVLDTVHGFVGRVAGAINGNLHIIRRILLQALHDLLINETAIGIDVGQDTHLDDPLVDLPEIRVQKCFRSKKAV